jgi:hypothetical protein
LFHVRARGYGYEMSAAGWTISIIAILIVAAIALRVFGRR